MSEADRGTRLHLIHWNCCKKRARERDQFFALDIASPREGEERAEMRLNGKL